MSFRSPVLLFSRYNVFHWTFPRSPPLKPHIAMPNRFRRLALSCFCFCLISAATTTGQAEDWGAYRIVSASTPEFVLDAVGGVKDGAVVSIQKPGPSANQKWLVLSAENSVRVVPAGDLSLSLSAENGGTKNGTRIVLEKDRGAAWQRWTIAWRLARTVPYSPSRNRRTKFCATKFLASQVWSWMGFVDIQSWPDRMVRFTSRATANSRIRGASG